MKSETTRYMFLSSNCRRFSHEECPGAWDGLGIEVFCECICHKGIKNPLALDLTLTCSNAIRSPLEDEPVNDNQ